MTVAQRVTLSDITLGILKNFSGINSNILIRPGNVLKTVSPMKNIMGSAKIEETFDREIAIWDLNQFLGTVSLFDKPDFEFEDKFVTIYGEKGASVQYFYSAPNLITTVNKDIEMPDTAVSFELKQKQLHEIQKASSVLGVPDLCVRSNGEKIEMVALDKKVSSSNSYSIDLGDNQSSFGEANFKFYFKVENLKMVSGDYTVNISEKVVSEFVNTSLDVTYYIALESDSVYTN